MPPCIVRLGQTLVGHGAAFHQVPYGEIGSVVRTVVQNMNTYALSDEILNGRISPRERLTEPYMTTRVRGTGLGLAIVKKIVEEHLGEIAFLDRPDGGTHVRIAFDAHRLAALASDDEAAANESSDRGGERGPIDDGGAVDGA